MKINIDGPYNLVRMEGEINGIKKVLYIFFDIHYELGNQRTCEDIRSKNITKYLLEQFDKIEEKDDMEIDFFMEIYPTIVNLNTDNLTKKYIWDMQRMFVLAKDNYKNIRFHYIDIRDYIESNIINVKNGIDRLMRLMENSGIVYKSDLFNIYDGSNMILNNLRIILDKILKENSSYEKLSKFPTTINKDNFDKLSPDDKLNKTTDLINKIKLKYNNKNVKKFINDIIKKDILPDFNEYTSVVEEFKNIIKNDANDFDDKYGKLVVSNIGKYKFPVYQNFSALINNYYNYHDYINIIMNFSFARIVDLYFLRRFLDKKYVKNAIIYCGGLHSVYYIKKLSELNFKVTHASLYNGNFKNINNDINNAKTYMDLIELFMPLKINQCCDITNFPAYFS